MVFTSTRNMPYISPFTKQIYPVDFVNWILTWVEVFNFYIMNILCVRLVQKGINFQGKSVFKWKKINMFTRFLARIEF
ncbi:MAG: hypothetical protein CO167_04395 [Candidatus Marinimicrobia bacterium CG_4_9_14_3_um_filter_48_9]|nr:MAG: hypothetical protein CO167_04395 [Candidatus Marinimicrobia bacterium CG_4_9_14_3_um_filter_48_9]